MGRRPINEKRVKNNKSRDVKCVVVDSSFPVRELIEFIVV
jgi:hypothetical protein